MNTLERLIKVCDAVFEGEIDTSAVCESADLRDDIGINSIGLLYMAMALEEEFGVKFVNEDFADIKTIADVIKTIEKKAQR